MTIAISFYAKVIDKVCLAYEGPAPEYVVQLDYLLPLIKKAYPELMITLAVRKDFQYLSPVAIPYEEIGRDFAFIKQFQVNKNEHPIFEFIKESKLDFTMPERINRDNNLCLVCPNAQYPSKSVHIDEQYVEKLGYRSVYKANIKDVGCVIGAENEYVFQAAAAGVRSILIPSGPGTMLYRKMFPGGEVYE